MRRLFIAAALGFGLFSATGLARAASANLYVHAAGGLSMPEHATMAPVHYERGFHHRRPYRLYYASPPHRHWQRYQPPPRYYHPPPHHSPYGWRR